MDTTSRLLMFLDIIEQGSFAQVADLRNIDRSVVSKQLTKLEDDLGVRLLNRSTRSFSLTTAGAEMVKKACQMRELLTETRQLAENYHTEPRGLLKMTASSVIGRLYLEPVIDAFQKRFPQVEVELRLEDRIADIVGEGYDLAFRIGEPKVSNLISRPLARNRLLLVASPKFIETYGEPQTIEELAKLPAATYAGDRIRIEQLDYIDKDGKLCSIAINSIFRSNDGDLLLSKALSHNAYCPVPAFLVGDKVKKGLLKPILTNIRLPEIGMLHAVYPHRDLPVRTRLFFEAVKEYIGEDVPIWEKDIPNFDSMYLFNQPLKNNF